jgi:dTDP-4-amino-4,6-dideoxy-D-glucose transaminase
MSKGIYVTKPILPPIEECMPLIRQIWNSKQLTNNGPLVQELEKSLGNYLGVKNVSLVNNATTGLMIAMKALGFRGEIITTPFSFIATAHAIDWIGYKSVFADTDKVYGNLDPAMVEKVINEKTGGILASHNFGFPAEIEKLAEIARRHDLPLVFDGAPAIGVEYKGKSITTYGEACVLSFHATKVFTTLEGGAIVSKTKEIKAKIDQLRNFNIRNEDEIGGPGINGKMNELQAAIGLAGIKYIEQTIQTRKERYQSYHKALSGLTNIVIPELKKDWKYNFSYFPIFFNEGYEIRETIFSELKSNNIHCRKYWYPLINKQPYYLSKDNDVQNAQELSESVIALPMGNDVRQSSIDFISKIIRKTINE